MIVFCSRVDKCDVVDFVQEYLEESLIGLVSKNREIMKDTKDTKDTKPIDWVRLKESDSIEQLRRDVRHDWAEARLAGKGAADWFRMFEKMGAGKYDEGHLKIIQHLFDTRNLVVHAGEKRPRITPSDIQPNFCRTGK